LLILKALFDQDINAINILIKNYTSIMNVGKLENMFLTEL